MALFDRSAATYDSWCTTEIGSYVDKLEKNIIFQLSLPRKGGKALDLGCGTGIYTIWLARMGLNVTGVDISSNMLEIAKEKTIASSLNIDYVQSDIQKLPFDEETFDLIVANIVLEFVKDPEAVVNEAIRVLKKGGRFVCGFIGKESSWGEKYRMQGEEKTESVFANATFFSPGDVKKLYSVEPDKVQLELFMTEADFLNTEQANALETEKRIGGSEKEAGYFAVRWVKPKGG
ncbi:class I SAM-dependent methyltransferase [Mesobacillus selenatarsenatis]|uniref:S-adenosylmethionine (SAM)-dependent methyltransferase n=1 Tax=Mesobacillus selenatarsenatis (strain DSM 18680 / JCM 14380 / FERM P-15431 / SF-1) TaxID=1321606 RepID=A0A0A8X2G1_MESS1|nr:class I SAM-dependent methyltransferase [Mesobacillus selenatarsenatis]GAM13399.1 S-adenosylmethionine (SAM) -dependent methyltransferase [Mesobacillus selenatarsenatis SF-1]